MNKTLDKKIEQQPLERKGKRPPRSQRIHRRKKLAEQRRRQMTQPVTAR
jgi:hypothetical protein